MKAEQKDCRELLREMRYSMAEVTLLINRTRDLFATGRRFKDWQLEGILK